MLKRKVFEDLLKWKNSACEKCLIVEGARQIGKTFIIREFAKANYDSFIELNFARIRLKKIIPITPSVCHSALLGALGATNIIIIWNPMILKVLKFH